MKATTIFGKILFVVLLVMGAVFSGGGHLFDIFGFTYVLVLGIGMLLTGFSFGEIRNAFAHLGSLWDNEESVRRSIYFWEAAGRNFIIAGVLGTVVGFVLILAGMDDPKMLGPALAVAFDTVLYALILATITALPAMLLNKRLKSDPITSTGNGSPNLPATGFGFGTVLGYILAILINLWAVGQVGNWKSFLHWPSLLIVLGGSAALVLALAPIGWKRHINVIIAFTGFMGALMGSIRVVHNLNNMKGIGPAMAFLILSCLVALFAMVLVGIPVEDRAVKSGGIPQYKSLGLSRIAWYGFPMSVLTFLILSISVLVFVFSEAILK